MSFTVRWMALTAEAPSESMLCPLLSNPFRMSCLRTEPYKYNTILRLIRALTDAGKDNVRAVASQAAAVVVVVEAISAAKKPRQLL